MIFLSQARTTRNTLRTWTASSAVQTIMACDLDSLANANSCRNQLRTWVASSLPAEFLLQSKRHKPSNPENLTQMRAFLGMNNYHGKFIRNLSSILQPLNQLLQSNQEFKWSPQCEEAFKKAKDALSSSNILVHYDPSLPVILESDANLYGIGEFIFYPFPNGGNRLIAYASSSLKSSESF